MNNVMDTEPISNNYNHLSGYKLRRCSVEKRLNDHRKYSEHRKNHQHHQIQQPPQQKPQSQNHQKSSTLQNRHLLCCQRSLPLNVPIHCLQKHHDDDNDDRKNCDSRNDHTLCKSFLRSSNENQSTAQSFSTDSKMNGRCRERYLKKSGVLRFNSSSRFFHTPKSSYRSIMMMSIIMMTMFCQTVIFTVNANVHCPHVNLIHRLIAPNDALANRNSQTSNNTPQCECTQSEEGGWEITCYANDYSSSSSISNNKSSEKTDLDSVSSPDYSIDYNVLRTAFIVRYEIGRQLKLICDEGAPVFKPALFQGFGIESIDTFSIIKCELPVTFPLSMILYRTMPNYGYAISSTVGNHSYNINTTTTEQTDTMAPIKNLYIKSPKRIGVQQLNTMLSDLDSLEQLTLSDFDLNDIDGYGIESLDVNFANSNKRIKRSNVTSEKPENLLFKEPITINTTNSPSTLSMVDETIAISTIATTQQPTTKLTTQPIVISNKTEKNIFNSTESVVVKNQTVESDIVEVETTISSVIITEAPETKPNEESDLKEISFINETGRNSKDNIDFEEDNINDVNIENKPIFVLDENALSFSRILPNLRVLKLRDFVKESAINNVIFQVINNLKKLEVLELTSNKVDTVPKHALSFASSSLKKLYLYKNSIKEIDEMAFTNLTRLEVLDMSHNQLNELKKSTLKPLKNLFYLSLKNNQLKNFSHHLFQGNPKLSSLDLSQNSELQSLPSDLFQGLHNLANISFAYCNMSKISSDTKKFFRNIPNLSRLDFKGNQLKNLTSNGLFGWNSKLNKLDLSSNQISEIASEIFNTNSSKIVEINLERNQLTKLPSDMFLNARNVRKLSLSSNKLREIAPMTFIQLRMLEELDLSLNQISTLNTKSNQIPFGIGGYLRKVDLSNNNLTDFDSEIGDINWRLYVAISDLNLKHNNFSGTLVVPIFMASKEPIINLDVSENRFESIDVQNLLEYSSFKDESKTHNGRSWETLVRLDNNPLNCDCFLFPFLNYTKSIGKLFNKNYYSTILRKTLFLMDSTTKLSCHKPEAMKNHLLNNLKLEELVCEIEDRNICPDKCQCVYQSSHKSATIDCSHLNLNRIPYQMQLSRFQNISLKKSSHKIDRVDNVVFQLQNNNIQTIDTLDSMIVWSNHKLKKPSFVDIYLDNNNVTEINESLLSLIDEQNSTKTTSLLRTLSLKNNSIQIVPLNLLKNFENINFLNKKSHDFSHEKTKISTNSKKPSHHFIKPIKAKIYFQYNPIDCHNEPMPLGSDCLVRDFKLWLSSHPDLVGDVNWIQCDENSLDLEKINSSLAIVNISDDILCPVLIPPPNNKALMALSIICVMLASSLFVVSVLYYRNKQTILAFIYIHLNPIFICLSFTEDDLDEDKIYDAFVSYSSSDRDIVMELIEKLEKPQDMNEVSLILQNGSIHEGKIDQLVPENAFKKSTLKSTSAKDNLELDDQQDQYRLCIHERDWLPGNLISWNIVNSVQNSKRTILILSQSFIKSIWFQVEFHTAYYQMLEDKMDRLIVIVRGELPPKEQLDKDLNFLLTTKTFLVWGEKWFWEKLYYAMPHKKKNPKNKFLQKKLPNENINSKKFSNGSALNEKLNGVNYKDGMLKWSYGSNGTTTMTPAKNGQKHNSSSTHLQDYVDRTIASHFQLNSYSNSASPTETLSFNSTNSNTTSRPAPKSLRNSGTLSNVTLTTLQAFDFKNDGYDNESFINETNT